MISLPAFMHSTAGATTPVRPPGELRFDPAPPTPPDQTIDWLTKQAADALARCDEASFNFWKAGLRSVAQWVMHQNNRSFNTLEERYLRSAPLERTLIRPLLVMQNDLLSQWNLYHLAIRNWEYVAPVPCPPATAPGQVLLVPLPDQPTLQQRTSQSDGDFKFVQGTQFGTLSVNLAADSGISCTYTGGVSTRLPLVPLAPGGVSMAPDTPPGGAPPANPGGTSIVPNTPAAGGTPDSPTTTAPPGASSPAGTQTATTPQSPGGNNTDTSPPAPGSAQDLLNQEVADIFFPPRSSPRSPPRSSPRPVVLLPPGSSPPPPGPATSDDPSTWSTAPPGGHPPDAVQPDGTYVSPETIEWFRNELDKLPRQSGQAAPTPPDQKAPKSTSPAPSSSPESSAPPSATARPQGREPSLVASQLLADILSGKDVTLFGSPPMTEKNPEAATSDKPGSSAELPAGAPTWIGPVPSGTFTPKITSRPETLGDSMPPPPAGTPAPLTDTPPASTAPMGAPSAPSPVASVPDTGAQQEIQVTVYFKPKLADLPQGEIPKTTEGHIAGLFVEAPALPGPPGSAPTQAMQNTGASSGVWRCRDDGSWSCTMGESLARPSGDAGTNLGLSNTKKGLNSHYQIDVPVSQTAGGVIETTGSKTEPNLTAPAGLNVTGQTFAVGPRTFTRLSFAQPFGLGIDPNAHFQQRFGEKYKIDFCYDEAPMGPHAIASSVLNSELPAAAIKLRLSSRPRSSK
jgi:hypothetical protein